jgi:hypothetical protein
MERLDGGGDGGRGGPSCTAFILIMGREGMSSAVVGFSDEGDLEFAEYTLLPDMRALSSSSRPLTMTRKTASTL